MFCPKCGAENVEGSTFCNKCGGSLVPGVSRPSGLDENVAGLLCYLAGWITGLIFLILEKENKFVRFHAIQSIVTFGTLNLFWIVFLPLWKGTLFDVIRTFIIILTIIIWIVLMVKAYQGEKYKLPVAGDIAEKHA